MQLQSRRHTSFPGLTFSRVIHRPFSFSLAMRVAKHTSRDRMKTNTDGNMKKLQRKQRGIQFVYFMTEVTPSRQITY